MSNPVEQFEVRSLFTFFEVKGYPISITNSGLTMLLVVGLVSAFFFYATRERNSLVPTRTQLIAELIYQFVARILQESAGKEGLHFMPLVFSVFLFILISNLVGLLPTFFTVTSQCSVTLALALVVIGTGIVSGIARQGFGFFSVFVPKGVPLFILPFLTVIEVISFLTRPITLSLRLFANMLGGHIALKVFASFVVTFYSLGPPYSFLFVLPIFGIVGLTALEFLVAFLQAYVFAVLASIYLKDSLGANH